ncbi:MAG: site-specific DNA-methyltransferase, partial [Methanoregulaceae archaeon]|nr:site-specific DNA-methyltransferase [Methanoregulaceae archaeon]
DIAVPRFINEFWTSGQRKGSSIHEISYRACFKPQLPGFFIERLTLPGDIVYDPFSGRGTTVIEAALRGRRIISNDINPLSSILTRPRLFIPPIQEVASRLGEVVIDKGASAEIDLSMFFHPRTEAQIVSLRRYLAGRDSSGKEDVVDAWCRMVATNRLTGHSKGFFSVYTLPPNQAASRESQKRINKKRGQIPEYRDVAAIILKKSKTLVRGVEAEEIGSLRKAGENAVFMKEDARRTPAIRSGSVQLTVTSPPFLDIVQYPRDNWMRCWFNMIDEESVERNLTMAHTIQEWTEVMGGVFDELYRITIPGGWVAFEVGEIRNRKVRLDEYVIPLGIASGFECTGVVINEQQFTKTSNIWGIRNNGRGTNTNRIVLLRKE